MQHHRLLESQLCLRDAILSADAIKGAIRRSSWEKGLYLYSPTGMSFTSDDVLGTDWEVYEVSVEVPTSPRIPKSTSRKDRVLIYARHEAKRLGHNFIGTGHIFLGLIELGTRIATAWGTGTAITVLNRHDIDLYEVCKKVKELIRDVAFSSDIDDIYPMTPGANRVFEYAEEWQEKLNCQTMSTGPILLGLLQAKESTAAQALAFFGLSLDNAYRTIQPFDGITKENIGDVFKRLTYHERETIKCRYGVGDGHCYSLEEVAKLFKVTRERIRQIEAKAIKTIGRLTGLTQEQATNALITYVPPACALDIKTPRTILDMHFDILNLSPRSRAACHTLGIELISDLVKKTSAELLAVRNFGVFSLNEIREALAVHGLSLVNE